MRRFANRLRVSQHRSIASAAQLLVDNGADRVAITSQEKVASLKWHCRPCSPSPLPHSGVQGLRFEQQVEALFKRLGKAGVSRDVVLKDPHGNLSQFDLRFGFLRKTYVECKCYKGSVPLKV
jgi:hypothetical protein